jgi:hypothetical protein
MAPGLLPCDPFNIDAPAPAVRREPAEHHLDESAFVFVGHALKVVLGRVALRQRLVVGPAAEGGGYVISPGLDLLRRRMNAPGAGIEDGGFVFTEGGLPFRGGI